MTADGVYPFTEASSVAFAYGQTFTPAHADTIDANAAAGADGTKWSDIAVAQTWVGADTQANYGRAILWSDTNEQWFSFGVSGGNPLVANKHVGTTAFATAGSVDAGAGLTPLCSAAIPGTIMVMGGTPGSASASKIRSATTGAAWTARNTTAASTESVRCLGYHNPGTAYLIAGLDNTAATNLEYSTNGTSWTQVTGLPNTNPRGSIASNGTIVVVLPYNTSTNKCITATTSPVTGGWTERTLPATQIWNHVFWDSVYERFIAIGATTSAYSDDGITWAAVTGSPSAAPTFAAMLGRVILWSNTSGTTVKVGWVKDVAGVPTWSEGTVVSLVAANPRGIGVGATMQGFMIADSGGVHKWTVMGGTLL